MSMAISLVRNTALRYIQMSFYDSWTGSSAIIALSPMFHGGETSLLGAK